MKILAKLAVASALALTAASGTATASVAATTTSQQIWATIDYLSGGQLVGGAVIYCEGDPDTWGVVTDTAVWTYYSMCP
jgi:hypothetical protein